VLGRARAAAAAGRRGRVLASLTALAALIALGTGGWAGSQTTPTGELTVVMGAPSQGKVTVIPEPEPGGSNHPCTESLCVYTVPQGTIKLKAEPSTSSVPACSQPCFLRWSEAECGSNPECETTLGESLTVAAFFKPVRLRIRIARRENLAPASVTATPGPDGPPVVCTHNQTDIEYTCPDLVYAEPTQVQFDLTVPSGSTIDWGNDGSFCDPETPDATTCTAVVNLDPFWVTVGFGEPAPIPFEIRVLLRVAAGGNGAGTVSGRTTGAAKAQIIDCGGDCSESLDYGRRVALTATPASGSEFDHWVGVCSTSPHCEFSAGAVTSVRANFRKAAPPPPPPPPPSPPPPPAPPAFSPRILGISVTRTRRGRTVVARIRVNLPTRAQARVERRRRALARREFRLGAGVRVLRVPLRRTVARGRAQFVVVLTADRGQRRTLRRTFVVPRRIP
jgi:List-Bact-rpt repeat protein